MNIRELAYRNVTRNRRTYSAYFLSSAFAIMAFLCIHFCVSSGIKCRRIRSVRIRKYVFCTVYYLLIYILLYFIFDGNVFKTRKRELGIFNDARYDEISIKASDLFENIMIE